MFGLFARIFIPFLLIANGGCELFGSSPEEAEFKGTLSGDVQNWATLIQNYILEVEINWCSIRSMKYRRVLQLANSAIGRDKTQSLFDSANYTFESKDGDSLISNVQASLGDYLTRKRVAAEVTWRNQIS